jgi:hypothetical protein
LFICHTHYDPFTIMLEISLYDWSLLIILVIYAICVDSDVSFLSFLVVYPFVAIIKTSHEMTFLV